MSDLRFPVVLNPTTVQGLPQEPIEFIVHEALLPALVAWLDSRGVDLVRVPTEADHLPAYVASPRSLVSPRRL